MVAYMSPPICINCINWGCFLARGPFLSFSLSICLPLPCFHELDFYNVIFTCSISFPGPFYSLRREKGPGNEFVSLLIYWSSRQTYGKIYRGRISRKLLRMRPSMKLAFVWTFYPSLSDHTCLTICYVKRTQSKCTTMDGPWIVVSRTSQSLVITSLKSVCDHMQGAEKLCWLWFQFFGGV